MWLIITCDCDRTSGNTCDLELGKLIAVKHDQGGIPPPPLLPTGPTLLLSSICPS